MELFIVKETYSDDDGNLGCNLYSCKTTKEAVEKVKELHNIVLEDYKHFYSYQDETPVIDNFEGPYFDIYLEEDYIVRTVCEIDLVEVN